MIGGLAIPAIGGVLIAGLALTSYAMYQRAERYELEAKTAQAEVAGVRGDYAQKKAEHDKAVRDLRISNYQRDQARKRARTVEINARDLPREAGDAIECKVRPAPAASDLLRSAFSLFNDEGSAGGAAAGSDAGGARPAATADDRGSAGRGDNDRGRGSLRLQAPRLPEADRQHSRGRTLQ